MAAFRNLLLCPPVPAGFPFHRRLSASSEGAAAPGFAGDPPPALSAWRSSAAASSPPRFKTGSKRTGPLEAKLLEHEAEGRRYSSRRFVWSKERTKFLTSYLMQQASGAQGKGAFFREDALLEASEAVSLQFQRQCTVADVQRRLLTLREKWQMIEKAKALGSASWDHATRMISMSEDGYKQHTMDHPKDSWLLRRPIEDYDVLHFIFGDDLSRAEIRATEERNDHSVDDHIPEDPMEIKIANEDVRYLVLKIGELVDA